MDEAFTGIEPGYYNEITMYDYGMFATATITKRGGKINYHNIGIEFRYIINERWKLSPYFHFNPWYTIASCENVYMNVENPAQNYSKEFKLLGFSENGHGFGEETGIGGVYSFSNQLGIFLELNHSFQHAFIDMEKSKLHPGDIGDTAVSSTTSGLNGKLGLILKY